MQLYLLYRFGAAMLVFSALAACSSTTGNNSTLNAQAMASYQSPSAKSSLSVNRNRLGACIAQQASKQRLAGAKSLNVQTISATCERFEIAYRASVMARVRHEWRNSTVLYNTANTSTRNLYKAILELFQ